MSEYSPLSIDYIFIRKIKIEAEYNNTVISTYEFKTDFAVALNSEASIDDFPLNWPALNTYLSSHGAVSLINMEVTFSGEDSRGNAVAASSSVSVWVD